MPAPLIQKWSEIPADLLDLTEVQLRHVIREQTGPMQKEMPLLVRVRLAFWEEYERAARAHEKMEQQRMYMGVCRNDLYFKLYDKYPALLAWVICPLAGYLLQRKELEFMAQERMIEILAVSAVRDDGRLDSRWGKMQVEIYGLLQDRIYGGVTQKIQSEQKSVNVNVNSNQTQEEAAKTIGLLTDTEEIDRRIAAVKAKRLAMQTIAQPIEIDQQKLMRPDVIEIEKKDKC